MLSCVLELAQKEIATGWDTQKLLHILALTPHGEGALKASFGFDVKKPGSSLNAFENRGDLMA